MNLSGCSDLSPVPPAQAVMQRETRTRYGPAPRGLSGTEIPPSSWQLGREEFLLRSDDGSRFHYRRGEGIVIERAPRADPASEAVWRNGTLHAAIACLNGLVPIHASAVAHEGQVFAFTGPSGAGKSTLAAALGRLGLPLFCDDTLVIDPGGRGQPLCLPGHKRLKLTEEALRLTGAAAEEPVAPGVAKRYALPHRGPVAEVLPLAKLFVLAEGGEVALSPVSGGEKLAVLAGDHYTTDLIAAALDFEPKALFGQLTDIAGRIAITRFTRPRDLARFVEGVRAVADSIRSDKG